MTIKKKFQRNLISYTFVSLQCLCFIFPSQNFFSPATKNSTNQQTTQGNIKKPSNLVKMLNQPSILKVNILKVNSQGKCG